MISNVELMNKPYENKLKILINGSAPSVFSTLDKFLTEPFSYWCGRILPELEKELNGGKFTLFFESRPEEIKVMEKIAAGCSSCTQFSSREILRKTPLTERMAALSHFLKNKGITSYRHFSKKALFILPGGERQLRSEIADMSIENRYCRIESSSVDIASCSNGVPEADIYFMVCHAEQEREYLEKNLIQSGFAVILSDRTGFCRVQNNLLVYKSAPDDFFDVVFECLILDPLMEIFTGCIESLPAEVAQKYSSELQEMRRSSVQIVVKPAGTTIEKGTSTPIRFESDIPGYRVREEELEFASSPKGIIRCNGMRVEGLNKGRSILYVYQRGEKDPCAEVSFAVIERNRVISLVIEDQAVKLGEGDRRRLDFTYCPSDADNLSKISWSSDDPSVVKVDSRGVIQAVTEGDVFVRITCEQVSAKTLIHVLPHIRDISIEESEIVTCPGESVALHVQSVPEITIEGGLKIAVMDTRIANAVSGKLDAYAVGDTVLVIQDKMDRIRKDIPVHVISEKDFRRQNHQPAKRGLLSRIFG